MLGAETGGLGGLTEQWGSEAVVCFDFPVDLPDELYYNRCCRWRKPGYWEYLRKTV